MTLPVLSLSFSRPRFDNKARCGPNIFFFPNPTSIELIPENLDRFSEQFTSKSYSVWQFEGGIRSGANAITMLAVAFDVDNADRESDDYLNVEWARKEFAAYAGVIHTTTGHSVEKPKFRVILLLAIPITDRTVFASIRDWLIKQYPYADPSGFTVGQQLYPACKWVGVREGKRVVNGELSSGFPLFECHLLTGTEGFVFPPEALVSIPIKPDVNDDKREPIDEQFRASTEAELQIMLSLRKPVGKREAHALPITAHARRLGLSKAESLACLIEWNALNKSVLLESDLVRIVDSVDKGEYHYGNNNESVKEAAAILDQQLIDWATVHTLMDSDIPIQGEERITRAVQELTLLLNINLRVNPNKKPDLRKTLWQRITHTFSDVRSIGAYIGTELQSLRVRFDPSTKAKAKALYDKITKRATQDWLDAEYIDQFGVKEAIPLTAEGRAAAITTYLPGSYLFAHNTTHSVHGYTTDGKTDFSFSDVCCTVECNPSACALIVYNEDNEMWELRRDWVAKQPYHDRIQFVESHDWAHLICVLLVFKPNLVLIDALNSVIYPMEGENANKLQNGDAGAWTVTLLKLKYLRQETNVSSIVLIDHQARHDADRRTKKYDLSIMGGALNFFKDPQGSLGKRNTLEVMSAWAVNKELGIGGLWTVKKRGGSGTGTLTAVFKHRGFDPELRLPLDNPNNKRFNDACLSKGYDTTNELTYDERYTNETKWREIEKIIRRAKGEYRMPTPNEIKADNLHDELLCDGLRHSYSDVVRIIGSEHRQTVKRVREAFEARKHGTIDIQGEGDQQTWQWIKPVEPSAINRPAI